MEYSLFGIGFQSRAASITAQERLNLYFEIEKDADGQQVSCYGTPGLVLFADLGETAIRGMHAVGSLMYVVHRGNFYEVNNAGTATLRGSLNSSSGAVYMDDNGTQVMIVDGTDGYTYTIATTTFAEITDAQYPANTTSVTYMDTYFVVTAEDTDQFNISANGDGTSWAAADFANAESSPDGLVRALADRGALMLFGSETTEFWSNTGAANFPFQRIPGAQCEWGLAARASLCKYMDSVCFLAQNRLGEVVVVRMDGYQPQRISDHDLEAIINGYDSISDATGFAYLLNGHPMYQLNFPAENSSWLYDGSTGVWSKLESGMDGNRHRAERHVGFLNKNYVSDYENGRIYRLDPEVYTENGAAIKRRLRSKHIGNDRRMMIVDSLELNMETGVGVETSPPSYVNALSLPGGPNDYASTPDSAALDITGDIQIDAWISADDYRTGDLQTIISKFTASGGQRSWWFAVSSAGALFLQTSPDGVNTVSGASTSPVPVADGANVWVRVTLDVDDGGGNRVYNFYTSTDGENWTQLGSTVTTAGATSIVSGTADCRVGIRNVSGNEDYFSGTIYRAKVYNGIGGTLVADLNADDGSVGGTSFASSTTGETWTLNANASIVASDIAVAQPSIIGNDPQAMLRVSKDKGHTWGNEIWTPLGKLGQYGTRAIWRRLGAARDFVAEITITEPVKVAMKSITLLVRGGRS